LHKVAFDKRRSRQTGFTRRKLYDGRPFGSTAAEGYDEHRLGSFAEIALIE
jgi:hypothetical protein